LGKDFWTPRISTAGTGVGFTEGLAVEPLILAGLGELLRE
jgi:hypothetical protein